MPPNSDAVCTVQNPFTDVSKGDAFCGDIQFLKDNGISTGYADGSFHPLDGSSRAATAAFLYRYEQAFGSTLPPDRLIE